MTHRLQVNHLFRRPEGDFDNTPQQVYYQIHFIMLHVLVCGYWNRIMAHSMPVVKGSCILLQYIVIMVLMILLTDAPA
jgi:hypothetical protein